MSVACLTASHCLPWEDSAGDSLDTQNRKREFKQLPVPEGQSTGGTNAPGARPFDSELQPQGLPQRCWKEQDREIDRNAGMTTAISRREQSDHGRW